MIRMNDAVRAAVPGLLLSATIAPAVRFVTYLHYDNATAGIFLGATIHKVIVSQ